MGRINSCLLSSYAQSTDKPLLVKGSSAKQLCPREHKEGPILSPRGSSFSEIEESRSLKIVSHPRRYS